MCLGSLISNINEVVCSILETVVSGRDTRDEIGLKGIKPICGKGERLKIGKVSIISSDLQRVLLLCIGR